MGRSNRAAVTDDSGLPLPGATVVVENTNRGVTTDFDGNFSINAQNGEVLIISYVGYQNSRVTVGNQSNYNISLQTESALEEVIVTAFGTSTKKSFTGSAAVINAQDLEIRYVELYGEGFRLTDHIRWDIGIDHTNSGASEVLYQNGFKQDKPSINDDWIFKIPQAEIDANSNIE
ncbi:MAG: carboxypeptidase-like regulatory domain-containing protein [Bacteroidetes bacterium]|nr:carboxypeptidase-like regulatory domain-containing protein [Bacteroidota bacterium]MDA0938602.1 carboxypeptidase-like regulatory domain-containing protein [Bacteroidota bacterium]MDA1344993.1 carboxypeptidase-like regulatory domain-containing protein [Bacteroidota bacterium]